MNRADLRSNIIPGMRYKDAFTAIDWLCDVLGFTRHLVVPDGKGGVAHAELTLGNGMIMLGSRRDDAGDSVVPPAATELWTQSAYIVAGDIEASYERAKAAQADIVTELEEQHYGGRVCPSAIPRDSSGISVPTTHGRTRRAFELLSATRGK